MLRSDAGLYTAIVARDALQVHDAVDMRQEGTRTVDLDALIDSVGRRSPGAR